MNFFKKLFAKKQNITDVKLLDINQTAEVKFASLNPDERLGAIISFGDTGQSKYFDLLKFSIKSDPDINIRFAALKRIHLFKEHPDLIPFLNSLCKLDQQSNLEPYLSMALKRLGIISQVEFDQRINNSAKETNINHSWIMFDKGASIGTFGSEGGKITEDMENILGARITIEKEGANAPYSITLGIYGLMFHTQLMSTEDEAKKFRDFAVKKINEIFALYEITEGDRDTLWHDKHNQLISELSE
jgi:hypothetical protein